MWTGPGFVDHHAHLLSVAAGIPMPWGDVPARDAVAAYHREVFRHGSTPMDSRPGPPAAVDLEAALLDGLGRAASLGLVEVTEAGLTDPAIVEALLRIRERERLPVRVRLLIASGLAEERMPGRTGDPWLDVLGVKFYADGWLGPRTCAVRRPFADRPDETGLLFLDPETLARRASPFAEAGWTIATHAIGDRAVEAVLDAYELIWGTGLRAASPRIEHAQILAPDLMARIVESGVVVCLQPSFAMSDSESALAGLDDRVRHAYAWNDLLDVGARLIAGSDHPIEDLSPLLGFERLVVGSPVSDPVSREKAWALMTDAGAGAVTLNQDPIRGPLHDLRVEGTRPRAG